MKRPNTTRRAFLKSTAVLAAPLILPARARGANAPSNRVTVAQIGTGGRGSAHIGGYIKLPDAQIVAVCDCHTSRRTRLAAEIDKAYASAAETASYKSCAPYRDFRDILLRDDIDAVSIATPDHWHVPIALAAVRAGKSVYVEKPLGVAVRWDQALRAAVKKHNAVVQYGTQQRSDARFRQACELARNGYLGQIRRVEAWCPDISTQYNAFHVKQYGSTDPAPVPDDLDYPMWLGPAPEKPYTVDRCTPYGAYHIYDYALGFIAGWGAHPLDIAQWGLDTDHVAPVKYAGKGELPTRGLYDTVSRWDITCTYGNGIEIHFMEHRTAEPIVAKYRPFRDHGTTFYGDEGWVSVDRGGIFASDPKLLEIKLKPSDTHLTVSDSHFGNFIACVKSGDTPLSPIGCAVQSDIISHLSDICVRTGREIKWDPQREEIAGDAEAAKMLDRGHRGPWQVA